MADLAGHICDECGSTFVNIEGLVMHYKQDHEDMAKKYLKDTSC